MDRNMIRHTVEVATAARLTGDKVALANCFAPGATYRMVGKSAFLRGLAVGPVDAASAIEGLVDLFNFDRMDVQRVVIDGDAAVIVWDLRASTGLVAPVNTELCDVWTFDADGKITSVLEFADTAGIADMLARSG